MIPEYLYVNSGDELKFSVKLVINGKPYKLQRGEKIWFDVKKYTYGTEETPTLIHLEQFSTEIYIPSVDLEPGDYVFDVGIIHENGTCKTIIPCIRNNVNKLVVGKRVYDPNMLRVAINTDDNKAYLSRFNCSTSNTDSQIKELYDITAELSDDLKKTFIVVQTMSDLYNIPKDTLVNGRIIKVVDSNGNGKEAYYSFNYQTQEFEKYQSNSDPRSFITVDTANDLVKIPTSELVHGKLVKVNRPKSNDSDNIPDIVEEPEDYYKPAYYSYDLIGNQWVLVNFNSSSGVTIEDINNRVSEHNNDRNSHASSFVTVNTLSERDSIIKDKVNGKLVLVNNTVDDDITSTKNPTYYKWDSSNSVWVIETFGTIPPEGIEISQVKGLEDRLDSIDTILSWNALE